MTGPKIQRRGNAAYIIEEKSIGLLGQSGRKRIRSIEGRRERRDRRKARHWVITVSGCPT